MGDQHARGRVWSGLHQDGNAEIRPAQRVGDGAFVAEVRQRDDDAVDFFAVFFEEVGAFSWRPAETPPRRVSNCSLPVRLA